MRQYRIIGGIMSRRWVKVQYVKKGGRKIYSCFLLESDLKNNTTPAWFGEIIK